MRKPNPADVEIIKPIWWRQLCLTLFYLVVAAFFAVLNRFGPIVSWAGALFMGVVSLLSLLDQLFEWSRLRIDHRGYSLRGWFRKEWIEHHEIKDFKVDEFAGKKLLVVELTERAQKSRNLPDQWIPFPCCFGHPVEQVHKIIRSKIDLTPRPRQPK
jgi:hypothetical protein